MGKLCNIKSMTLKKNPQAFSLIELLVVAAIVSYSISAILATFTSSVALNEMSRNLTTATVHAEYILENIKDTTFANIPTDITNGVWNWNTASVTSNGLIALNSEAISVQYTGTNPLKVTVSVAWNDLRGRSRSQSLQTLITG
jgi:prepilin-type N-terminal cleavage/methylation domain-containing protein